MSKLMDVVSSRIEPGDSANIDKLVEEFRKKGFEADYKNLDWGYNWCWSVLVVRDGPNAVEVPIETSEIGSVVMDVNELDRGEKSRFED